MAKPPKSSAPGWARLLIAEGIGTFLLVFLGCGAVNASVAAGAQSGLWQVAIVWGLAIMVASYAVGGVSGAHINPAISVALAVFGKFPWRLVPLYVTGQMAGAIVAAAILFVLYGPHLAALESRLVVERGEPGSELIAMVFGEYYPSPGPLAAESVPYSAETHAKLRTLVPWNIAFAAELVGTLILGFVVFALTDDRNPGRPAGNLAPVFIGLTVAGLISVIAPLTQACFNPARDLGPRLVAYLAGWGPIAIPGPNGLDWLGVYVVAPTLGACLGAGLYQRAVQPGAAVD
jgi:glycerol uptake facilitator protein